MYYFKVLRSPALRKNTLVCGHFSDALTLVCYFCATWVNSQQNWFPKNPFWELLEWKLVMVPYILMISPPRGLLPDEPYLGGQEGWFFLGRLLAKICPPPHPCFHQREVRVTCQPWGGAFKAPNSFQILAFPLPRLPLASVIGSRKRTSAIKIQNIKQQNPQNEQYSKATSEEPFLCWPPSCAESGCLGSAPSSSPWSRPMYCLGALVTWFFPPSGLLSLGGVNESEARTGPTVKFQP